MAEPNTGVLARRGQTLRLRNGRTIPVRQAKPNTPEERVAAIRRIAGSIKTDVIVDRSFYRSGR